MVLLTAGGLKIEDMHRNGSFYSAIMRAGRTADPVQHPDSPMHFAFRRLQLYGIFSAQLSCNIYYSLYNYLRVPLKGSS